MTAAGANNSYANLNDIIFTFKGTKLYAPVTTLWAKNNQKLFKLLSKGFERSDYWNHCKTKKENENTTTEYRYFVKPNFVGFNIFVVLVY